MKTVVIFNKKSREITLVANLDYDHEIKDPAFEAKDGQGRIILEKDVYSSLNAESLNTLIRTIVLP